MKIKYLLSTVAIVAIAQTTYAQYAQDALRFSTFQPGGTARIKALGNAGTAIGGDLSSISNNPAGLGFFTHSELSITPEYNGSKVKANYFGNPTQATKNSGNLSNAAVVFYAPVNTPKGADKNKGWLSVNFGAAYARTNNFYQNTYYNGVNPSSSIANYYAEQAFNSGIDQSILPGWAYDQNLIDKTANGTNYRSNALSGVNQAKTTYSTGGQSEVDLAVGANYSNKFYLGLSLGITDLRYNTTSYFDETGTASILEGNPGVPTNRAYASTYTQDQVTRGTGFNLKLGFIYKPVDALRIGASIATPTWYNIDDSYGESLATRYTGNANAGGAAGTGGDPYTLSYNLRTPFRASGGVAVFIKDYGFITGDVEYLDYSSIHLDYDGAQADNNDIKTLYKSVVNAHVGAEIRAQQLYFRGGYGLQGNPLKQYGGNINTASGGIGYRFSSYYIDATYQHVTGNSVAFPYELATATSYGANLKSTYNNVFLTLGLKF
ncbi:OmpP1/FadL family transporter [Mucilaginibacter sp. KACC 22063]|uniref:OmpP1/FadL family transporter n=1 Tax=Mucilaginibacter sp. KACC 22063 TaxID=3025666 RepID=UPI002366D273|nr:hypothetical protein [Mucilaginibacter sp. KACC 22063]WDF53710.1 hypothetical protein PQ461_12220 [Mucilaginibacter sp. KACC 22063]